MRICDITGWPPSKFSSARVAKEDCSTDEPDDFVLDSVCFINGHGTGRTGGDLVLVIRDARTDEECTTRIRIEDAELGRRLAMALGTCKGLSLDQAGNREIHEG